MGHTKNHNRHRRNNKKRQTKKSNRGGGLGDLFTRFRGNNTSTPSGNSTDLNAEAAEVFKLVNTPGPDGKTNGTLDVTEYGNLKGVSPLKFPDFKTVAGDDKEVDLDEFTTAYYFAKVNADGDTTLDSTEYANLQKLLPGAEKIDFKVVAQGDNKIEFNELLPLYYFLKASGSDANIDSTEYANLQKLLPGADKLPKMPEFSDVAQGDDKIEFHEFLPLYLFIMADKDKGGTLDENEYRAVKLPNMPEFGDVDGDKSGSIDFKEFLAAYKPPTGGRRRRKRSTRNKRKSNKKRRTVKRRKSAKRSRRRK
jgi:hypothetical protein